MKIKLPENVLLGVLGIIIGASFTSLSKSLVEAQDEQLFINPYLQARLNEEFTKKWQNLDLHIRNEVDNIIKNDAELNHVSVHIHHLKNGLEVRYNDELPISGGSLLKVPLMIGHLKTAETDKQHLVKKVFISDKWFKELYEIQGTKPQNTITPGQTYTVEQLISSAIVYSDNVAAVHLEKVDNNESLLKLSSHLNVPIHNEHLTTKGYSEFFKILYHANYLNPEFSNAALLLLSQSKFDGGLRAGVPRSVDVAHKFGEKITSGGLDFYFNHCGIIYEPKHPYVLCISTLGKNLQQQMLGVEKISATVFTAMTDL